MKKAKLLYIILFFILCLCPFIGMFVTAQEESTENRELAEFPSIKTEEGWNIEWLSEAGDYFQEHFAFRNELVTANAVVNGKILGTSTASGVIQGTDGWLYYTDSLTDYLGSDLLSDRSLFNIAHTLSMMQNYLEQKGVQFLFTVAPNKNSLYGENMPYYDSLKVSDEKNLTRLKAYLEQENVSYADLYEAFGEQSEVLYHKKDSHWNNQGAALASDILMTALGKDHDSYEDEEYEIRSDFEGDLDGMLYPQALTLDEEVYYDKQTTFAYVEEVSSNFAPKISTVNPEKEGNLVMYRDSFGNALLPFMADAYAQAYFSRGVPYQLSDVDTKGADTVIVERAERFLPEMAQSPPVMQAPQADLGETISEEALDGAVDIQIVRQGPQAKITGRILDGYLDTDSRIFLRVNGNFTYEACPIDIKVEEGVSDSGFNLYLQTEDLMEDENSFEVIISKEETFNIISKNVIKEEITQ
jgi:hypothetical protein